MNDMVSYEEYIYGLVGNLLLFGINLLYLSLRLCVICM